MVDGRYTDHYPRFDRIADDVGDGTGVQNMNIDGSVATGTPTLFSVHPPDTGAIVIQRVMFFIRDGNGFKADTFGALPTVDNGVQLGMYSITTGELVIDYQDKRPTKSNACFARYNYDSKLHTHGNGDEFLTSRWTLDAAGTSLILPAGSDLCLGLKVQDDLRGLFEFLLVTQGYTKEH